MAGDFPGEHLSELWQSFELLAQHKCLLFFTSSSAEFLLQDCFANESRFGNDYRYFMLNKCVKKEAFLLNVLYEIVWKF